MTDRKSFPSRLVTAGFAAILLFAVFYTALTAVRPWPGLPYRALRDSDLAAGLVFAAAAAAAAAGRGLRNSGGLG
jgi:hypothetical protein